MINQKLGIVLISKHHDFIASFVNVFLDLSSSKTIELSGDDKWGGLKTDIYSSEYEEIKNKAIRYLNQQVKTAEITLILAQDKADLEHQIQQNQFLGSLWLSMFYLDRNDVWGQGSKAKTIRDDLQELFFLLDKYSLQYSKKSCSYIVFDAQPVGDEDVLEGTAGYIQRLFPSQTWHFQVEIIYHFMNFYDLYHLNILETQYVEPVVWKNTLGQEISRFLSYQHESNWMLYYFTGSVVSAFINYLEYANQKKGILCLRGPNEHSLACGALANWQLCHSAFLIVVTSGMMDEFKGTLSNLREAGAKGFIICAENSKGAWFPFQGTKSQEENMAEILKARNIPCVYIETNNQLKEKLIEAYQYYDCQSGPVAMLVTREVLEGDNDFEESLIYPPKDGVTGARADQDHISLDLAVNPGILEKVMNIINCSERKILWQCGILSEAEQQMVYDIAEKAGIALVDSLHHPGSVAKYYNGKINNNYIGTLSLYGYSKEAYTYLFTNGKLNDMDQQCIFFLKSKVSQISTPFSEGKLKRSLFLIQVTHNPDHAAPFIDIPVIMDLEDFLRYIQINLKVNPNVLDFRQREIGKCKQCVRSIVELIPTRPLYPNYFFSQLNNLIEEMIENDHYEYTGVFDVGRCSISAIRHLARTGPGFSGWYGRALMGDALQAVQYIALKSSKNILAFIGDGAKSIVPNILPSMLENLSFNSMKLPANITIFYLYNGTLSLIESFLHYKFFTDGARQTKVYNFIDPEDEMTFPRLQVSHKIIDFFNKELIKKSLLEPAKLNFFSVILAHNNEGDSVSILNEEKWFS